MPISSQQKKAATKKLVVTPQQIRAKGAPPGSGHASKAEILARMRENNAVAIQNGILVDMDGNPIVPYEVTMAEFATLVSSEWTGIDLIITNRHINSQGVGGLRVRGGSKWTLRDPQVYSATRAQNLTDFPAANYPGWRIFSADYGSYKGGYEVSDGTAYNLESETIVYRNPSTSNVLIIPSVAASAAADNAGTVRLTFGSAHNITAGVAIPGGGLPAAQLYVTATGGGFTADTWHTITAVPDATHIDIATSSAGITGAPTLATVASASVVTMRSVNIPPMTLNGSIVIEATVAATTSANNKNLTIKLGGSTLFAPTFNSATNVGNFNSSRWVIANVNSRLSQKGNIGSASPFGIGTSTSLAPATSAIDTSGGTTLTFNWQPAAANERMYFEHMMILARP